MECLNLNGIWNLAVVSDETHRGICEAVTSFSMLPIEKCMITEAQVPGNYELDLERAGKMDSLFYGKNILKEREMEWNHLFYSRLFQIHKLKNVIYRLCLEGIDTISDIYINGHFLAHTDNMLIGYTFEIPESFLNNGDNELLVHISPVVIESRKHSYHLAEYGLKYETDSLAVRKSAFMYGWDIFPRILSGGIWKDIRIEAVPEIEFLQSYLFVRCLEENHSACSLEYFCEIEFGLEPYDQYYLQIEGHCDDSCFQAGIDIWSKATHISFNIKNPVLWWPARNGNPKLYQVSVKLLKNGSVCCEKNFRFGIRTAELKKTSLTDQNAAGEFCFLINHRRTFILGTNWVPLDSYPSQGKKKIKAALELVLDLKCNMIRCWGGGYYEDESFYELCDEMGIMVWQDFMQACGLYPQTPEYLTHYGHEILYQVQRLRQHTSLVLWAGDNENDSAHGWKTDYRLDPNHNKITRELIPDILRQNDYIRDYLPSSPYMDETAYQSHSGTYFLPEQHLWGPRDYFKSSFYRCSTAHFASETGYHGCPSPESIQKFITPDSLQPAQDNGEWLLHASSPTEDPEEPFAYRIQLMKSQIQILFGFVPDQLKDFSLLSQISQAEALKFFIERFRIGKWKRTGIIWWNILDGCPQFSDAVVDYYFSKKLAYYYIQRSQEMLVLIMDEQDDGTISLTGVNDYSDSREISFCVHELYTHKTVMQGKSILKGDSSTCIAILKKEPVSAFYQIDWELDRQMYHNHYVSMEIHMDHQKYLRCARESGLIETD